MVSISIGPNPTTIVSRLGCSTYRLVPASSAGDRGGIDALEDREVQRHEIAEQRQHEGARPASPRLSQAVRSAGPSRARSGHASARSNFAPRGWWSESSSSTALKQPTRRRARCDRAQRCRARHLRVLVDLRLPAVCDRRREVCTGRCGIVRSDRADALRQQVLRGVGSPLDRELAGVRGGDVDFGVQALADSDFERDGEACSRRSRAADSPREGHDHDAIRTRDLGQLTTGRADDPVRAERAGRLVGGGAVSVRRRNSCSTAWCRAPSTAGSGGRRRSPRRGPPSAAIRGARPPIPTLMPAMRSARPNRARPARPATARRAGAPGEWSTSASCPLGQIGVIPSRLQLGPLARCAARSATLKTTPSLGQLHAGEPHAHHQGPTLTFSPGTVVQSGNRQPP